MEVCKVYNDDGKFKYWSAKFRLSKLERELIERLFINLSDVEYRVVDDELIVYKCKEVESLEFALFAEEVRRRIKQATQDAIRIAHMIDLVKQLQGEDNGCVGQDF